MITTEPDTLARYRAAIAAVEPDAAALSLRLIDSWDSVAVAAGGRWIFKFPKSEAAAARLRIEAKVLAALRPRLTLPVPHLLLHETPELFSQHVMLPGSSLEPAQYSHLDSTRRDDLAARLARLYAELHAIPNEDMAAAGATPIEAWMPLEQIAARARPLLPRELHHFVDETLADYAELPDETTYGYFDGHGWNMAFDHRRGVLNGVFDFADSGFGPIHRDLCYSDWIAPDLTDRIIPRYHELTGYPVDRERITLHSSALRLWELAAAAETDPAEQLARVIDWAVHLRLI
jgi:Phosphotransferase enzyme family